MSGLSEPLPLEGEASLDEVFAQRMLSGNPDTVARKLLAYLDVCEIDQLNCVFQVGSMSQERVRTSMRLFAQESHRSSVRSVGPLRRDRYGSADGVDGAGDEDGVVRRKLDGSSRKLDPEGRIAICTPSSCLSASN